MRVLAMRRISAGWTDRAETVSDFAPAVFQGWDQGWELAPDVAGLARAAAAAACATTERGRMRRANDQRSAARQRESQTKQKRSATSISWWPPCRFFGCEFTTPRQPGDYVLGGEIEAKLN